MEGVESSRVRRGARFSVKVFWIRNGLLVVQVSIRTFPLLSDLVAGIHEYNQLPWLGKAEQSDFRTVPNIQHLVQSRLYSPLIELSDVSRLSLQSRIRDETERDLSSDQVVIHPLPSIFHYEFIPADTLFLFPFRMSMRWAFVRLRSLRVERWSSVWFVWVVWLFREEWWW